MTERSLTIGINCYPTYGGSGVIATEIGMAMAKRGHRVHFICYDVPRRLNRFTENIFFHEVEVHEYPLFTYPPYSLSLASKFVEVSSYEKLDILHVHYAVPHATSAFLAKQVLGDQAPKVITTLHGTDITLVGNDRSYLPITRFSIVESDGVTAPSEYLKNATYDKLNVSSSVPITVIPNFVDIDKFRPLEPGESKELPHLPRGCEQSDNIIIHVSNFRPVKRLDDVIHTFAKAQKRVPCHLILIGDGPERSRIEALVREMNLEESVCFLGKQESFVEILQRADVFLLPSESESFGLAALEALSCGVPVVASDAAGLPEVIPHGEVGFLAPVGDTDTMAEYVERLLTDKEKQKEMGRSARQRVEEHFSLERLATEYERYYYSLL